MTSQHDYMFFSHNDYKLRSRAAYIPAQCFYPRLPRPLRACGQAPHQRLNKGVVKESVDIAISTLFKEATW